MTSQLNFLQLCHLLPIEEYTITSNHSAYVRSCSVTFEFEVPNFNNNK